MLTTNALAIHIAVMVGWSLLIVLSLMVKRYGKNAFKAYLWMQSLGVAFMMLGTIGITIISSSDVQDEYLKAISKPHVILGYLIISLAIAQPITGGLTLFFYHYCGNSGKEIFSSWYYKFIHTWVGRIILLLLATNIFLGVLIFTEDAALWKLEALPFMGTMLAFVLCLAVLALITLLMERQRRNRKEEERQNLLAQDMTTL